MTEVMIEREKSKKQTMQIIHKAKTKDEISNAIREHFKKFVEPSLPKKPYEDILAIFDGKVETPANAPLFR